ncbi:MAG: hypothetical protein ACJ763_01015, partial [Bdellovibrionia bacterium]
MNVVQSILREPQVHSARQYRRHVMLLSWIYWTMFLSSVIGVFLLVKEYKLFVTLAQRSNVETLTIAFLLIFFLYLGTISTRGAVAAVRVAYYRVLALFMDRVSIERRKVSALGKPGQNEAPAVALNYLIEREGRPNEAFELRIQDEAGEMGSISVDGALLMHRETYRDGTYSMFPFIVHQIARVLKARNIIHRLDIVEWLSISDESLVQYIGLTRFASNLSRHLGNVELWPRLVLKDDECKRIEAELSKICSTIRDESFFPHWEYGGDH